jgi:hypothetical protein
VYDSHLYYRPEGPEQAAEIKAHSVYILKEGFSHVLWAGGIGLYLFPCTASHCVAHPDFNNGSFFDRNMQRLFEDPSLPWRAVPLFYVDSLLSCSPCKLIPFGAPSRDHAVGAERGNDKELLQT